MGKEKSMMQYQANLDRETAAMQNEWQAGQNDIDRQWQQDFYNQQFETQSNFQQEMFDVQNEYNLPANEVARLQAAGINPAAYYQSLGTGSAGGFPSAPSPSGGSSHSVTPIASSVHGWSNDAAIFSSIAQLNDSVAQLAKAGVGIHQTEALLKPTIQNLVSDTKQKQEEAAMVALQRSIQEVYGSDTAAAQLNKLIQDAYEAATHGNMNTANGLLSEMQSIVQRQQGEYNQKAMPVMLTNLQKYGEYLKSASVSNYASAQESYSVASVNSIVEKLRSNELKVSDDTVQDLIDTIRADKEYKQKLPDELQQEIEKLERGNKWPTATKVAELLGQIINIGFFGAIPVGKRAPTKVKGFR